MCYFLHNIYLKDKQYHYIKQVIFLEVKNKNFTQLQLWKVNSEGTGWEQAIFLYDNLIAFLKNYDVSIDFRTESLRFAWRAFLARVPIRIGGSPSIFSRLFFTHFTHEKSKKNIGLFGITLPQSNRPYNYESLINLI